MSAQSLLRQNDLGKGNKGTSIPSSALNAAALASIAHIIEQHQDEQGALLPMLHAIQEKVGFVPAEVVPTIANALNISRAEVHGVITYYHFFRQHPAGKQVVQICRAEACQAMGGEALAEHAKAALGCNFHETSADGQFTLEPVYCLGQCGCAPSMTINNDVYARMSVEKFNRLIAAKRGAA
ncbi:formate dehydrogenase subunit gamma [Sapientia aquatica]|uniref:Formate dehydrogenase subunit gamma n=1 Tax=Sapientia aquatica TaxID=1549640 RepID=A0A4V3AV66_9BURK|nr:formate dehydrogenase subunit gamma [Sapientia aquatica]TDK68446.1 formate dehydrogenase subunit gamma [Sapientia aquatica]